MTVVKTRKVGNSTTITIPKELNIPTGQEYNVYKASDGTLLLSPSKANLLEQATDNLVRETLISELADIIEANVSEIESGNYLTLDEMEANLLG